MASKTWVLTDVDQDIALGELTLAPADTPGPTQGFNVRKRMLRGGMREGVEIVEIDNSRMQVSILPTRGMGLWKAGLGDIPIGWNSPVKGPVHPKFVPVAEPSGLGWLDGFDELLCRCGLLSNGAPDFDARGILLYPLHGRIANLPAHKLELTIDGDTGELALKGVVDETRFHFHKLRLTSTVRTNVGEPGLRITDAITNIGGHTAQCQLLYHINFGPPITEPGSRLSVPAMTVMPRDARAAEGIKHWDIYGPPDRGSKEQVYFFELSADEAGETQVLLKNPESTRGVSLHFNVKQLPCFTVWKNTPAMADGYVTGLEPATNYPNPRTHEKQQGRVVSLDPGQTVRFDLAMKVHDAQGIADTEAAIAILQSQTERKIYDQPQPGWTVS